MSDPASIPTDTAHATSRDALAQSGTARLAAALPLPPMLLVWWLGTDAGARAGSTIDLMLILVPGLLGLALRQWLFAERRRRSEAQGSRLTVGAHLVSTVASGAAVGAGLWLALRGDSAPAMALMAWTATFVVMGATQWRLLRLRTHFAYALPAVTLPGLALLALGPTGTQRAMGAACLLAGGGFAWYAAWVQRWSRSRFELQREAAALREDAERSRRRLEQALDKIESGFALYDAEDRLVIANHPYRQLIGLEAAWCRPRVPFEELLQHWVESKGLAPQEAQAFIAGQRGRHRVDGSRVELPMEAGRTVRVVKHVTPQQEVVALLTDLSDVRAHERELELARSQAARAAQLLQESIDAIDEGLSIWAPDGTLKMCNQAYRELVGRLPIAVEPGVRFEDLLDRQIEQLFSKSEDLSFWPERRAALVHQLRHPPGSMTIRVWSGRWRTLTTSRNSQGDTVMITVDVTALKQQALELAAARDAAEAADRAKSSFLATMSHEIRTPMNGVLGMLEVLQHHRLETEQREILAAAQESARTLLRLIDEVLDFSKIEAGALQLDASDFSLSALIGSALQVFRASAQGKGLVLASAIEPGSSDRLIGDPVRVRQILDNLVGNAIKFTDQGCVAVSARTRALGVGRVELEIGVVDTGIGIEAQQAARLFQPFAQADGSITRRFGGTGLGLSIVQRLARAMDGDVTLKSDPGRGSAFTVTLQLLEAPADSARQRPSATVPPHLPVAEAHAAAPRAPALRGRVLVVDDHPINRRVLQQQLRLLGLDTLDAGDGAQALACVEAQGEDIDAVLCDVQMPQVDGYEFTRRLRVRGGGIGRLPVVAVTANVLQGEAERCLAAGMDAYLGKPVTMPQLRATLARWLPLDDDGPAADLVHPVVASGGHAADYDPARLADLFGDDRDAVEAMRADFRASAAAEIESAMRHLRQGDLAAVAVAAHRIKGAAANVGAARLAAAARALESAARAGLGAESQSALGEVSAAARAAEEAMREV